MIFSKKAFMVTGKKIVSIHENEEVGHVYLYLLKNDLNDWPLAVLEDLFVKEEFRRDGMGSDLVKFAIMEAKRYNCYKIIATSRNEREDVHKFYEKLGFEKYGFEFRMNLQNAKTEN